MQRNNVININTAKKENENTEELVFYGTKELAHIMRCSVPTAREIMHRADFPLIMVGKNCKVSSKAFEKWSMERRV